MSIVGVLHLRCGLTVCGHVYAVDANEYLHDLADIAEGSNGNFTFPRRYCPRCAGRAISRGLLTEEQQDLQRRERLMGIGHGSFRTGGSPK